MLVQCHPGTALAAFLFVIRIQLPLAQRREKLFQPLMNEYGIRRVGGVTSESKKRRSINDFPMVYLVVNLLFLVCSSFEAGQSTEFHIKIPHEDTA